MKKLLWVLVFTFSVNMFSNGISPKLSNFRIKKSYPSRIYFDSSEKITGSNVKGFIVSDNSISGIKLRSGQTTEHYFIVSTPFTFWNNSTIRYKGGSNLMNNNNSLQKFNLEYIKNNLSEPKADANIYYVSLSGSDKNSGKSESKAWRTIKKAAESVKAGSTVWIKSGNYGTEYIVVKNNGKIDQPIKFIGYKKTPGDISSMYYNYGSTKSLDSNEMPLIRGNGNGQGIRTGHSSYIIVRNIQIDKYNFGVDSAGKNNIFDGLLITNSKLMGIEIAGSQRSYNRILNTTVINAAKFLIRMYFDYNLINNCKVYADAKVNNPADYYISIYDGSNCIIRNSSAQRIGNLKHEGHGISLKGSKGIVEHNLIEDSHVDNIAQALELRHLEVKYNIIRNVLFTGNKNHRAGGISLRDNTSYNTIENCKMIGLYRAVRFTDNRQEQGVQAGGHHNKIINSVFTDCDYNIVSSGMEGVSLPSTHNEFLNCTFYNSKYMFDLKEVFDKSNKLTNCNIVNVEELLKKGSANLKIEQTFNNYYNGFSIQSGTGNISKNPKFEDASRENFRLKKGSPLIDIGKKLNEVGFDHKGNPRPQGTSHDIGAFEYNDKSAPPVSTVTANAGEDVEICSGNDAFLSASGGGSYRWSTGETTKDIIVSTSSTKTYTVTVSDGVSSDTDDVIVVVNSVMANAGPDVTIEQGESVTLNASIGDSYLWNNGDTARSIEVSPNSTKSYKVTITKGNCKDTDRVRVMVNSGQLIAYAGEDVEICRDESITLTASGGGTYLWNTGETTKDIVVSPFSTNTYTVTVSDGISSDTDDVTVMVNRVIANAGPDVIIEQGESTILTANEGDSYLWTNGETTRSITVSPEKSRTYKVVVTRRSCSDRDKVRVTVNIPVVMANAGEDMEICRGDNITLSASGGNSYKWSTGETTKQITVNPSSTQKYTVTVSDGISSDTDDIIVAVNNVIANAGSDVTIEEGASTTLTASGGDSYLWNNGATTKSISVGPSSTSNYTVTVTKNNCFDTDSVQVTINISTSTSVFANAGEDVEICSGDSTTLTASGGGKYKWSTGETSRSITVNPSTTSSYTVTVSESGSSDKDEVIVVVNSFSIDAGSDVTINEGENVTLTASGGNTFEWNTGENTKSIVVSPNETTVYSVTAYSNVCVNTDKVKVTVIHDIISNPMPATAFAGDDISICLGESITLNGTGGDTYTWSTGTDHKDIEVNPTRTTTYTLTANRGGVTTTDTVVVSVENCNISAVSSDDLENNFDVYPNPAAETINISLTSPSKEFNIILISTNGSIVYKDKIEAKESFHTKQIDLSRLAKGVYFVRLFNADQNMVKKILVI